MKRKGKLWIRHLPGQVRDGRSAGNPNGQRQGRSREYWVATVRPGEISFSNSTACRNQRVARESPCALAADKLPIRTKFPHLPPRPSNLSMKLKEIRESEPAGAGRLRRKHELREESFHLGSIPAAERPARKAEPNSAPSAAKSPASRDGAQRASDPEGNNRKAASGRSNAA